MLDWYLALFVYSTYPHTHKRVNHEERGKEKDFIRTKEKSGCS